MPIRSFDEWASGRGQTLHLSALKDAVVGIDASYYLHQHLNQHATKEPLLIALGGFPFALKTNIEKELHALKDLGITPVFVFNGLDVGKREPNFAAHADSSRALEQAWEFYDQQQADQVVDAFSSAGSAKPESLYTFLQRILHAQEVDFIVAPYSAAAQLAYLDKDASRFVDAVFGPSDLFLFDVDKIITRIDTDVVQFTWITRHACQEDLGRVSNEQFIEFCLLLGSPYLRTFPPFESSSFPNKGINMRDAMGLFNSAGRSAVALCTQFEEDPRVYNQHYTDRFKRAYVTIKHHVVMDMDGKVGPLDPENASSDLHELIGQRLPEELCFYMSKGIIGAQVPNWLTSGEVLLSPPLGAEDSEVYRRLVGELLTPIRTQSLCLLSNSLHRFYQTKSIHISPWYDRKTQRTINLKDLPSVKDTIVSWKVPNDRFTDTVKEHQANLPPLTAAAKSLKDFNFVSASFTPKDAAPLSSKADIISNVTWRFLQLRGYVNEKHQLTQWGQALEAAFSSSDPAHGLEEPVFLAVELLRLGLLGASDWFPNVSGGPMRGSDEEKKFNLLVSRVACTGKIHHRPIGYSGPLSRQLLSFRSLIYAVRSTLRDLVEVILATLLLNGEADRDRTDWTELSLGLPFIDDNDCGLGIAVRTYLDDLPQQTDPTSPELRAEVKAKGTEWFQHAESFGDNLDTAFRLWDAVYIASQNSGGEVKDAKYWAETNKWLQGRR